MTVLEKINHRLSVRGTKLVLEKRLSPTSPAIRLLGPQDLRKRLGEINFDDLCMPELEEKLSGFNITPVVSGSRYPSFADRYYDCRDWTFDRIGRPKLTYRDGGARADILRQQDLRGISWCKFPVPDAIVAYFFFEEESSSPNKQVCSEVFHWGIVEKVEPEIRVISKWGDSHVYRHPLDLVPTHYGDALYFFKVKK
jgi:hypothetical protein